MKKLSVLETLGFKKIDRQGVDEFRASFYSRNERRLMNNKLLRPTFTPSDIVTFATDRNGDSWVGPGNVDLTSHGFINNMDPSDVNRKADPRYN